MFSKVASAQVQKEDHKGRELSCSRLDFEYALSWFESEKMIRDAQKKAFIRVACTVTPSRHHIE